MGKHLQLWQFQCATLAAMMVLWGFEAVAFWCISAAFAALFNWKRPPESRSYTVPTIIWFAVMFGASRYL